MSAVGTTPWSHRMGVSVKPPQQATQSLKISTKVDYDVFASATPSAEQTCWTSEGLKPALRLGSSACSTHVCECAAAASAELDHSLVVKTFFEDGLRVGPKAYK